ncbi:hypothetical protein NC652_028490 [Populus alba x Populus x berolinensis]|uniref:Uncharacterized protein n=1 Tax=Populus alba x Populus x berolinensis TaxID=444605 RepID=A0AAD6M7I3_9ROSI|nr:hypothetical protein NC651_027580 [Populus alba x Populus x berolinensis]KAJ6894745.1 hypothetical protein NC652_028490 [Populus alba x Populus x berolinensis]KAJ6980383.1 hypothetical protein NC653_028254 [Populus alba x Populus x berolinensis]
MRDPGYFHHGGSPIKQIMLEGDNGGI